MDPQLLAAIKERWPGFWAVGMVFTLAVAVGLTVAWLNRPLPFASDRWKQTKRLRPRMVRDLLKNYDLVGRSQGEIDDLLGPPSERNGGVRYVYRAGYSGVDDYWLELNFSDGRVSKVNYRPD